MGRIRKGILGGFSGKVGTVVGANWRHIAYMRSLPQKVRNPRTEAQLKQRSRMALVVSFLRPMTAFLRTGWKLFAKRQSAFNAATAYMLANAIRGTFPNYQIDFDKVLVTRGSLPPVISPALGGTGKVVSMQWGNNSNVGSAKTTDKALAVLLNPASGEVICIVDGATRVTGKQDVTTPDSWEGASVHCYLGFISEDGKEVSNSFYYGNHTLPTS